ncbi:MAG: alpha-L-fucosidase [Cyclobacteriaceae bacterium]|nr:alpha-L-fucosidase [Cyclobacteriaceae bacterium]
MNKVFASMVVLLIVSCSKKEVAPPAPLSPVPSEAQMAWHEMELTSFVHFTINTFTGLEWGMGSESPSLFKPDQLDAEQWVSVLKETGFNSLILTCKHHDGFCLWPSQYTEHSIKNSPYKNGKGDLVREVSEACKKYGLKFGIYLSPWDRNHAEYGGPPYITYYRDQLKELFTNYGPVYEMWFDGANGGTGYYGGTNQKRNIDGKTYYDWPNTLSLVKSMEPNIIFFSDAGPGVRWVGNERGIAGETNWNSITPDTLYAGKAGIEKLLGTGAENGTAWIPAEVDVSIRPGWFYHAEEDSLVKSPEQLFEIYLSSVGRGSTLLLNIPPDKRGLFHENDVASLRGFKQLLEQEFTTNLAANVTVTASSYRGDAEIYSARQVVDDNKKTYWSTDDGVTSGQLELNLVSPQKIKYVVLQEYIRSGQRVKSFYVEAWVNNAWQKIAEGTTIGYKRILRVAPVETSGVRLVINEAKASPMITTIALY